MPRVFRLDRWRRIRKEVFTGCITRNRLLKVILDSSRPTGIQPADDDQVSTDSGLPH